MKRAIDVLILLLLLVLALPPRTGEAREHDEEGSAFLSSLHHTASGMGYWYHAANGGLETVTGVPYSELACSECHVESCETCHRTQVSGKAAYSTAAARDQVMCLECHAREAAVMRVDASLEQPDVHVRAGMRCMDCHTASDVHGDGTGYVSMKQPGAVTPTCEGCHDATSSTVSHTVHSGKLDCKACHVRHVVSCTNCHFETLVTTGRRVAVPVSGWVFLMNYDGKVTSANMQTFVVGGDRTFLMFAPQFSHSVMRNGRECQECHATEAAAQALSGRVRLLWLEGGEVHQAGGPIPVAAGARYDLVFQNYRDGTWTPIQDPAEPRIHYAGYGEPLAAAQMEKLAEAQGGR